MGSGRGKNRRTRSSIASGKDTWARVDLGHWDQLTAQPGLRGVTLFNYYGTNEFLLLAQNIYADLVSIGALQFPVGSSAEDYEIQISSRPYLTKLGASTQALTLLVRRKSDREERIVIMRPGKYLHPENQLSGNLVHDFAENLVDVFGG
jgi:hypothetical protein